MTEDQAQQIIDRLDRIIELLSSKKKPRSTQRLFVDDWPKMVTEYEIPAFVGSPIFTEFHKERAHPDIYGTTLLEMTTEEFLFSLRNGTLHIWSFGQKRRKELLRILDGQTAQ